MKNIYLYSYSYNNNYNKLSNNNTRPNSNSNKLISMNKHSKNRFLSFFFLSPIFLKLIIYQQLADAQSQNERLHADLARAVQTYSELQELLDNSSSLSRELEQLKLRNEELLEALDEKDNIIDRLHTNQEVFFFTLYQTGHLLIFE